MLRELKGTQRLPRVLAFRVDGTGTASLLEGGNDGTLTDNGTGDYTIAFRVPFQRVPIVQATPLTVDSVAYIHEVSASAVTIRTRTVADAPAAVDADFHLSVHGFDSADQT